jgi:hypothetical protein
MPVRLSVPLTSIARGPSSSSSSPSSVINPSTAVYYAKGSVGGAS